MKRMLIYMIVFWYDEKDDNLYDILFDEYILKIFMPGMPGMPDMPGIYATLKTRNICLYVCHACMFP